MLELRTDKTEIKEENKAFDNNIANFTLNVTPDVERDKVSSKPLYYVESPQCKIPYVDPFSKDVMMIYKPMVFETCTNDSDLVTPFFDFNRKRYVLHIDESVAAKILNSSETEFNCYYQEITRYADHDSYDE